MTIAVFQIKSSVLGNFQRKSVDYQDFSEEKKPPGINTLQEIDSRRENCRIFRAKLLTYRIFLIKSLVLGNFQSKSAVDYEKDPKK